MLRAVSLAACLLFARSADALTRLDGMRSDGAPVYLPPQAALSAQLRNKDLPTFPFKPFSTAFVAKAKATPTDWVSKGAVTPAKDQGATGACGTFGRTAAAEGQWALRGGSLTNFSEAMLYECVGWDRVDQQQQWFSIGGPGWETYEDYPYNTSAPSPSGDVDPPIPGRPCKFDASKVVPHSAAFTNATGAAPSEDQLVAFVFKNGPVQTGIYSGVFALREKGCEATGDCWITTEMCSQVAGKDIDHSITLTGYGTDPVRGDYWLVKNSWSQAFANNGFIFVARGVGCGQIDCCGNTFTIGDPSTYYE